MTEYDMVTYLESDATLDTLLGSAGGDGKIYPILPKPEPTLPYVLFKAGTGVQADEILEEDSIQLTIRGASNLITTQIRDRIRFLLNRQDEIQSTVYATSSNDYYVYWSRYTGGDTFKDPDTQEWNVIMFFNVKFKPVNWF